MPELPEVQVTLLGIAPHLQQQVIKQIIIRQHKLRWPVSANFQKKLPKQKIIGLARRAKYLLIHLVHGDIVIHLGMSGSLRILPSETPADKHDHIDLQLMNGYCLRYKDPRRFGAWLWQGKNNKQLKLFSALGVEPLADEFNTKYLFERIQNRKMPIKQFMMDQKIVVGVGNIYATESLFIAKINPLRPAAELNLIECKRLVKAIKNILHKAILQGGTTLRDFSQADGKPGYFRLTLQVYGRANLPCVICHSPLVLCKQAQRSTVYCKVCQH